MRAICFICFVIPFQRSLAKISIVLERRKRILVTVLDWGLGHATRCVPVINALLQQGAEVMIAGSGASLALLQQEFAALKSFELTAYNPYYPADKSMVWTMAAQLPKFIQAINKEQQETEAIIKREQIDVVISDNRYGCYTKLAKCYIIAHQLNILMPEGWQWMEPIVNRFNHAQLKNFDGVWCPANDATFPKALLKGHDKLNLTFIGFLSRMKYVDAEKKYKIVAICSGPEPQRGLLEEELAKQLSKLDVPTVLVAGRVEESETRELNGQLTIVNYMGSEELNKLIMQSEIIVARSGYSTVMDLMRTGTKAILIPTAGQTEQEYIAAELMAQKAAYSVPQQQLDLKKALKDCNKYTGFSKFVVNDELLTRAIKEIL